MENWKDIEDFENLYQVSDMGRVCRLSHGVRKIRKFGSGGKQGNYDMVVLCKNGVIKGYTVHSLVARAFVPNPNNLPQINHKDENTHNNAASNLEWCDSSYNNSYGSHGKNISNTKSYDIFQWTKTGEFVRKWHGISNAARVLGICRTSIQYCLSGRYQTAGGYVWTYGSE